MKILRYLKKASGRGLFYTDYRHTRVVGFSDADWAGALLIGGQPQDIVSFLEEILS